MAGLLDFVAPEDQQMLGLSLLSNAFQGLANPGQARNPMEMLLGYKQASMKSKLDQLNLDEMQRKLKDQDAAREVLKSFYADKGMPQSAAAGNAEMPAAMSPSPDAKAPGLFNPFGDAPGLKREAQMPSQAQFPTSPGVMPTSLPGVMPKANVWQRYQDIGDRMALIGNDDAKIYYGLAEKYRPKFKADSRTVRLPDGRIATVNMSEDGAETVSQFSPAEKLVQMDLGGQTGFADPYSGQRVRGTFANKTMTPDSIASNALGRARLAFDQGQANRPQFKDGYWVSPPQPGQATGQIVSTPIAEPPKNSSQGRMQASQRALPLIDQADELLNKATGSYLGAGADLLAQTFGASTGGAKATAQLKALEGSLMMAQPRMEGPQSDKDTALYRQMAGQIGDNTIPVESRRAALKTIRELHMKYANPGAMPAQGGARFLGFE